MGIVANDSPNNPFPHGLSSTGFKKLNKYKFDVIMALMKSNELLKLLKYRDTSPLSQPNVDPQEILYKYVFPFKKEIDTTDEAKSLVKIYFLNGKGSKNVFKNMDLIIDILVDLNVMAIEQGTRDIEIMDCIDRILNNSRGLGLGQLAFDGFYFLETSNMNGYRMVYKITDIN